MSGPASQTGSPGSRPRLRDLPALAEILPSVTARATLEAMMSASKPDRLSLLKTAIERSASAGRNLAQRHCSCHRWKQ